MENLRKNWNIESEKAFDQVMYILKRRENTKEHIKKST